MSNNMDRKIPFLEIIEWVEQNPNILMWKVPDQDKEIKNGAKLIVRESQNAMLLSEGKIADIFGVGNHTLETKNIPIFSSLKWWKYWFESPFKADVYFFSTKQFVNLKWWTPAPVLMKDSQFGQVRVRAFGSYNVRITDPAKFFKEYAWTYPELSVFELEWQLRDFIAPKFAEILANQNISVVDVAWNLTLLSEKIRPLVEPYLINFWVEVTEFVVSSVTLPDEVTEFYDKTTSMNMIWDMNRFKEFNTAVAIWSENNQVSSSVQEWVAMWAMLWAMQAQNTFQNQNAEKTDDSMVKLQKLKNLFDNNLIDEEEYKAKKAEILSNL